MVMYRKNSTIAIKEKMLPCGHYGVNFSGGNCVQCSKIKTFNKQQEREISQTEGLKDVIADLDAIFSTFIRLKYTDREGKVKCYTCDTVDHYLRLQNGHYVPRSHLYLRWDTRNCRPQCVTCNCHKYGMALVFSKNLEIEYPGLTEILYEEKQIICKPSISELKAQIGEYSERVLEFKKKLLQC